MNMPMKPRKNSPMNMHKSYTESTPADKGKANLSIALDLAAAGIPVFPCRPDKTPLTRHGFRDATTDPATIRAWWKRHPSAAPGIPTGRASGLAVLDLDRKGGKDGVAAIRAKGIDPDHFPGPVVETPSGGLHLICRHHDGLTNAARHLPDGADVRAEGGYIIAPGAWIAAGRYKPLRGDVETDRLLGLPAWPKGLEPPPRDRVEATPPPADVDLATVKDALRHIPNDGSHDDWTRTLMAVHHATGGSAEGLAVAAGWSAGYAGFSFREVKAKWSSFRRADGDLVTAASLFKLARQHGWAEDDALGDLDDLPEGDDPDAEIARLLGLEAPARPAGMWMTPRDCANAPRAPYIIKGLIAEGQVAAIVGAPGAGKSILAPALAYAVAQGREAFGRRTRRGGVFYVAAEDQMGMAARITALRQEHGEADDLNLGSLHNLFPGSDNLKRLRKEVSRYRPKLIVIDTLAMAFPGLKENEAEAMNSVVQAAKALTKWGAAVVLIHHDTKAGTDGLPRGHSVLNGALDVSLHLTRDGGTVTARPTKNRNGTCDQALAFDIGSRVIGKDEDGDDVTAPIAEPASPDTIRRGPRLSPTEEAVLGIFDDLGGGKPVDRDALREAAMSDLKVSASEDRESRKRSFNRAMEGLARKGVLETLEVQGCGNMIARHRIAPDPAEEFEDISVGEDAP